MAALAVLAGALALAGAPCSVAGEWPHTGDAGWLWRALHRAGFEDVGCTGSAFVVVYPGTGVYGHDLYVWAFTTTRLVPESPRFRTIAGVRVYGYWHRAVWRAGRRNVWVEAGPTAYRLPAARVLARLIRATT